MKTRTTPLFSIILIIIAAGLLLFGHARDGFWLGVVAVFLLWWADNDRKRVLSKAAEAAQIAETAPELVGKDFVQASAYILDEIDKFNGSAAPAAQQRFAEALAQQQAAWKHRGESMPHWATLKLLRESETVQ